MAAVPPSENVLPLLCEACELSRPASGPRGYRPRGYVVTYGQLLDSIVSAIVIQEGRPPLDTNPGDLRDCPWFPRSQPPATTRRTYPDGAGVSFKSLGKDGVFWDPRSRAEGLAGAYHVVALHIAELNSLAQLISDWAPPNENQTGVYLQNVMKWTGITNPSVPLITLVAA
jgi:hypothetical protein